MLKKSASMSGLILSKFVFGGMMPLSIASIDLIIPAKPLEPSRCPRFDFTAPLVIFSVHYFQGKTGKTSPYT